MTFTNLGGDGSGPAWLAPLLILLIVIAPVVVGLLLRFFDRTEKVLRLPAFLQKSSQGVTIRSAVALTVALLVALLLALVGARNIAVPLTLTCLMVYLVRYGLPPRE